jgi:hypothetical protein
MRIGFIENDLRLVSSGACNLVYEWYKLLKPKYQVTFIHWKDAYTSKITSEFKDANITYAGENPEILENYDILIVNHLGEPSEDFYKALENCKRAITVFVYHDRTVIRDIYTDLSIKRYIDVCDYVLTYQPEFLVKKLEVPENKVKELDIITFYKDPKEYLDTRWKLMKNRPINMLYCNRTNNFKGAKLFMGWCEYLRKKEETNGLRIMKGFNSEFPHKDLPNYKTLPMTDASCSEGTPCEVDFFTDDYGDHEFCKRLLKDSRFVWVAQDYSKYPEEHFDSLEEYMSYLNPDFDGTTLEAIFSGCIPILHEFNRKCALLDDNELSRYILFYNPEKGYDDLYQQYKQINVNKAQRKLKELVELYQNKQIFLNGLELNLMPQSAFDLVNAMAMQIKEQTE